LDKLSTLLRVIRNISSTLEMEPLSALILDEVERVAPCTNCSLLAWEDEALVVLAHRGALPQAAVVGRRLPAGFAQWLTSPNTGPRIIGNLGKESKQDPALQRVLSGNQPEGLLQGVRSWIAVPLVGQRPIGWLTLAHHLPNQFTPEDVDFLSAIAGYAAVALEHAQLYQRSRAAAADEERQRLARELHDAVTQTLFAASLIAEALPDAWEHSPEVGRQGLHELNQLTHGALAEMRTLLLELHPATFANKPLGELLRPLCEAFTSRTGVPVAFRVNDNRQYPAKLQIALYRITQEALNNIAKHAQATAATVTLYYGSSQVALTITDNGVGFTPDQVTPDQLGLTIMRERADSVGAHFRLDSRPQQGTQLDVVCEFAA
jgi:two-component system nitrate/nitrite sensor histidine kinase NarX